MLKKLFKKNAEPNFDESEDKVTFRDIVLVFITQILLAAFIVFSVWGTQKLYTSIDTVVFPEPYAITATAESSENEKGIALLNAISNQMQFELNSTFGWSANDIIFNKFILDNRAYRQYGVYNATKTLIDFYSTDVAKLGNSDKENDNLYSARMNHFALSPSRWGFLFIPSAESSYKKGLESFAKYEAELAAGEAVYNLRNDDVYNAFELMLGDKMLGHAIGLLQNSRSENFAAVDNNIYEVQGMVLVLRDFFNAIYTLYPDMVDKNNQQNYENAMYYLDQICEFDPLLVTKTFNSSELIISYLLFARNRIEDIKESIRI